MFAATKKLLPDSKRGGSQQRQSLSPIEPVVSPDYAIVFAPYSYTPHRTCLLLPPLGLHRSAHIAHENHAKLLRYRKPLLIIP